MPTHPPGELLRDPPAYEFPIFEVLLRLIPPTSRSGFIRVATLMDPERRLEWVR